MHHQLTLSVGKDCFCVLKFIFFQQKAAWFGQGQGLLAQAIRRVEMLHRDRQLVPITQPPSIQHIQSMAAAIAELTCQN